MKTILIIILVAALSAFITSKAHSYKEEAEQAKAKKLLKCAYNLGKAKMPRTALNNPCVVLAGNSQRYWDRYGRTK
jgi:hypothetical protein